MGFQRRLAVLNLLGLVFGVVGGLLLFFALTLKPSDYRLVKTRGDKVAICLDNKKVEAGYGGPLAVSAEDCPDVAGNGPTPQIEAHHPAFVRWGLALVIIGFAFQLPSASFAVFLWDE
jgi:hypothetical protein